MSGKVALVNGGSRGVGRGIARGLGAEGFTVYVTGRSEADLEAAAREIDAAGGKGVAQVWDLRDDAGGKTAVDRIRKEQGRLDLLVNCAAFVSQELIAPGGFWEKSLGLADMITIGLRSNYVAAWHAVPLMLETGGGVIAHISSFGAVSYHMGPAYGAAKAGTDKMTHDMAVDIADRDLTVVSFWPGYVLTEQLRSIPVEYLPPDLRALLPEFETPEFDGKVLAALIEDPDRKTYSGKVAVAAQLALKYGIRDLDGKQPKDWTSTRGTPTRFFEPAQG